MTAIRTRHDDQWKRYATRFGQLNIRRDNRALVSVFAQSAPSVSIPCTRLQAAQGLRIWRAAK